MEEQRIVYKTAELAKKKGFPQSGSKCWVQLLSGEIIHNDEREDKLEHERCTYLLSQPTQSLLQKWLRDIHKCIVLVRFYNNGDEWEDTEYRVVVSEFKHFSTHDSFVKSEFKTYEEALEVGLQEALKLIEL